MPGLAAAAPELNIQRTREDGWAPPLRVERVGSSG